MFLTNLIFRFSLAHAAACCGGGAGAPALIVGDERASLAASLSQGTVDVDVDERGFWRGRGGDSEMTQSMRIEGAHLISDRWQVGAAVPALRRTRRSRTEGGLGDVGLNLGYEAQTDWDYHPWRPKGLLIAQLTAPTGPSVFEATDIYQISARGRGFWTLALGAYFTKSRGRYDFVASLFVHRASPRTRDLAGTSETLRPGWGGTFMGGVGYDLGSWRLGTAVEWLYEDAIVGVRAGGVAGASAMTRVPGNPERVTTGSLQVSFAPSNQWSWTFVYADQTWFGRPTNTALGQTASVTLLRRFAR